MIRKGQARWVSDDDVRQQNQFIDQLFNLAARDPAAHFRSQRPPSPLSKLQHLRTDASMVGRLRRTLHLEQRPDHSSSRIEGMADCQPCAKPPPIPAVTAPSTTIACPLTNSESSLARNEPCSDVFGTSFLQRANEREAGLAGRREKPCRTEVRSSNCRPAVVRAARGRVSHENGDARGFFGEVLVDPPVPVPRKNLKRFGFFRQSWASSVWLRRRSCR